METKVIIICILTVIVSYFMGNISPAILIGRLHGIDIKKEGSGNAGTTNVLRVLGKKAAVATLLIDIFKGVFAVLLGKLAAFYFLKPEVAPYLAMACGLAVFCGHIWPIAFGFKGGKGVATAFGVLMAVSPFLGLVELGIVILVVVVSRMVSMGSVAAAVAFPFVANYYDPRYLGWGLLMALIVLYKHNTNITRLVKGEESKISFKK
ncbi:glycerol-3-phosphate 1-O-acyltransferase PlsY [Aminipila sp.]|jgi:glycerol-3-phosphate acyltransferase PlsY|uniref:glycerol-3-phosphate 1-O-acyltransferase PlsY n=1 Tax=Aminipila sp. TaxID=2060095 RepID=UPI001D5EE001|nr:glycerol-3-phosphate 1-O-acyltransferase PlsY [Aminipila sp.]MBE6033659.1 glycerol-3-phosphate 1-O-acyltransferase PlsY [Clostridiales bacterium]